MRPLSINKTIQDLQLEREIPTDRALELLGYIVSLEKAVSACEESQDELLEALDAPVDEQLTG